MGQTLIEDSHTVQIHRCLHGSSNTHNSSFPQFLHHLPPLLQYASTSPPPTNVRPSSSLLPQHD
ncbi:hypothetical protein HanRHA438_Chr11g0496111 [Helianthus annuus]|nr:hypothetical protein HanIR_Chr11g0520171 [Helianthus annuus]KAJ0870065.1 hypothetical protein HanRHA438_Chr11g0496111 [Helianthus annuus]